MQKNRRFRIFKTKIDSSPDVAASEWVARRDAGLTADEARAFHDWENSDPRNRVALARFDSAWSAFDKPRRMARGDALLQELSVRSVRRRGRRLRVAAAAAIVMFGGGLLWIRSSRAPVVPPRANISSTAVVHQPTRQVLPDGSVVDLDAGARISVEYGPKLRRITLIRGEALFRVAKNPSWPFVVGAVGVEVKAVGTVFAVELTSATVEVLVTEGKVSVKHRLDRAAADGSSDSADRAHAESPAGKSILVGAGNRLVVAVDATMPDSESATPLTPADTVESLAWSSPRVEFSGTPLAEAIDLLNQYASESPRPAPRLVIGDQSIATMRVSGKLRTDNTEAFVALLEVGFGVKAERLGDTIVLRRMP